MARLSQKDAQGHGEGLRSWFTIPKAVSNAVTTVKAYVSPERDRTRDTQDRSMTPPTPSPRHANARATDAYMQCQLGNKESKGLSLGAGQAGSVSHVGSLHGKGRARTAIGTSSSNARRNPSSRTQKSNSSSSSVRTKSSTTISGQGSEEAAEKAAQHLHSELNGSPRIARKHDSYAPTASDPLLSPTKPRPSKRQKSSDVSGRREGKGTGSETRPSTPRILQWHKEPRPGTRSSSRVQHNTLRPKREGSFADPDKENESHKDEDKGISEGSLASKGSLKRKRDVCAENSQTPPSRSQPKRDAELGSDISSPSRSSTETNSSRTLQSFKFAAISSPSNSSISSIERKRKRDSPEGTPASRLSVRETSPENPNSTALEAQESEVPAQMPRHRSVSVSSNKTIEDVPAPREDVSRQLWKTIPSDKSSRDRGFSSSPPSPEPNSENQATSFSFPSKASTSFSSLLRSSQPSKRIVSHGQEVVLGSDEDSDDSLPDVGVLFKKKNPNPAPKVHVDEHEPKQKYTFSMQALLQEEEQAKAANARIEAAKSRLQSYSNNELDPNGQIVTSESAMACLVENVDQDEGNARRVREALRRTEVLDYHDVWHFFDEKPPTRKENVFPRFKTPNKLLASILNDPAKRQQAVVSGFLTRLAAHTALPKEIMLWMMEEVCREPKALLVQSYINILESSAASHAQAVTPDRVESLFKQLGVTETALTPNSIIPASKEPLGIKKRPISSRAHALVTLIERLANHMTSDARKRALHLLALASFDVSVVQDCQLSVSIEAAIDTLLQAISEEEFDQEILNISKILFSTVTAPVLRQQLISALPCYSSRSHRFRRQLALAFTLKSATHLESSLENTKTISHVLLSLHRSRHFHITKKTDYMVTRAYFSMLDVAVDGGFSDLDFTEPPPTDCGPEERHEGTKKHLFAARAMRKAPAVNVKEKAFNEEIDGLARELRDIMALIPDSGASDMTKTECKATAGRLVKRLENGVRTKPKPMKDFYHQNEQGRDMMDGFVKRESGKVGAGEIVGAACDGTSIATGAMQHVDRSTAVEEEKPHGQDDGGVQQAKPLQEGKVTVFDVQQKTPPHSGRQEVLGAQEFLGRAVER